MVPEGPALPITQWVQKKTGLLGRGSRELKAQTS